MNFASLRRVAALLVVAFATSCRDTGDEETRNPIAEPAAAMVAKAPAAPSIAPTAGPAAAALPATPGSRPGTTAPGSSGGGGAATTPPPPLVIRGLDVHPIDEAEGEDGRGNRVPAVRPVALDVRADSWPGRALDPVLEIGDLQFRHYSHPDIGVLRYVAADGEALPAGAPVSIRWRDDGSDRMPVVRALQVTP